MNKDNPGMAVRPDFSYTFSINKGLLESKADEECCREMLAEQAAAPAEA